MVRTQIQLTDEQAETVRELAMRRGVSMAAVIRGLVDDAIATASRGQRHAVALTVVGKHRSGSSDGATEHDRHLTAGSGTW